MKAKIAIVGSGNIGWALKQLLKKDYDLKQGDIEDGFDANDISQVEDFLKGVDAVISAGPFAVNKNIASVAAENGIAYFDLTEDVEPISRTGAPVSCVLSGLYEKLPVRFRSTYRKSRPGPEG